MRPGSGSRLRCGPSCRGAIIPQGEMRGSGSQVHSFAQQGARVQAACQARWVGAVGVAEYPDREKQEAVRAAAGGRILRQRRVERFLRVSTDELKMITRMSGNDDVLGYCQPGADGIAVIPGWVASHLLSEVTPFRFAAAGKRYRYRIQPRCLPALHLIDIAVAGREIEVRFGDALSPFLRTRKLTALYHNRQGSHGGSRSVMVMLSWSFSQSAAANGIETPQFVWGLTVWP